MLLAGDIGGAKTDLAIFSNEAGPHAPLVQAEARNAGYHRRRSYEQHNYQAAREPGGRARFV